MLLVALLQCSLGILKVSPSPFDPRTHPFAACFKFRKVYNASFVRINAPF
jgi:hypothetical protein